MVDLDILNNLENIYSRFKLIVNTLRNSNKNKYPTNFNNIIIFDIFMIPGIIYNNIIKN